MRRGPVIHGALLLAALLFAYQTWTREETLTPLTGDVVVWAVPPPSIQAITLEAEGRVIRIERRSDAQGPYLWGLDTRIIEEYEEYKKGAPDASTQSGRPFAPVTRTSTREFMVSDKGEALIAHLSELRALRALGKLDEDKHALYELNDKTQTISVIHDGGTRSLRIGGKVFGGSDRYALDPSTGEGYVIAQVVTRDLANGEAGMRLNKIHDYADDEVGKAIIEARGQKRTMVRITATDDRGREGRTWADAQTPTKPDQTMANFLRNIDVLRPARFAPEEDVARLERVLRVEYQTRAGAPLGWLELYQQPIAAGAEPGGAEGTGQTETPPGAPAAVAPPSTPGQPAPERRAAFLMRTELTRVLAGVPHTTASRIVADIEPIFGQ
jgi:hypothetical protein